MSQRISAELAALRIDRAPTEASRPRSRAWIAGLALVGAACAGAAGVTARRARVPEVPVTEAAPPVSAPGPATELTTTGYVVAQRVARVGAKVWGRVVRVEVREGQAVRAGDLLFALDAADQQSAIAAARARAAAIGARARVARASLAEARQLLAREQQLVARGASPAAGADDLAAKAETLAASVQAADAESAAGLAEVALLATGLRNLEVRAPIDGVATGRPVEVGDVVGPGTPLVELSDFSSLLVEVDVPESRLGVAREGAPCEVVLDALPDQRLRGEVVLVAPRVNRAKATGMVKVRLLDDPPGWKPDMAARVSFVRKENGR